jgi:hypothetical protein
MAEYIDLAAARAFVEANYQGDPLLRHTYMVLLDKLPTVPDSSPMFLLKSAPADADILKTLASSPVIYSTGEETIIPIMPDRWISVTERLPKEEWERCIEGEMDVYPLLAVVKTSTGARYTAKLFYTGENFVDCDFIRYTAQVTHWMPLPEPPKEESHG